MTITVKVKFRWLRRWVVCAAAGALVAAASVSPAGAGLRTGPGGDIAIAQAASLVPADMNGDGHDDVVMGSVSGVDVLLSDGAGRLVPTTEVSVGAPVTIVVTGDFDGDARTDVAVATSGSVAHVLLGDGHGGILEASGSPLPDTAGQVTAADFNGDGLDDLALSDYFVGVRIRLSDGNGRFTEAPASPVAAIGTHPYEMLAGDFDSDGVADLVVRDALAGTLRSYRGTGTGDFTAMSATVSVPASASDHVLRSADLNADSHLDLLVAPGTTSSVMVLLGDVAGQFTSAPGYAGPAADVVVADFNGDGHVDIATSDRDFPGFVGVRLGDGTGTFRDGNFGHGPVEWHPYHLASGDFDGDTHPDVAAGVDDATNSIEVLLNEPTPAISAVSSARNPSSAGELVTLTVTVTALAGTATPAGTVTFYEGVQPVGTGYVASFVQNHSATYTAGNIALGAGDHVITARFSGEDALAPVVSAPFTQTVLTQTPPPTTGPTPTPLGPRGSGYWMLSRSGTVYAFGGAASYGNAPVGNAAAVDMERTTSGNGYWVLDDRGDVFPRGDARDFGGAALHSGERAVSLSATRDSGGYWVFTDRGRAITRGNAVSYGDMTGTTLNGPVRDSVATPSGNGYWMVSSDGGIFSFGDAHFVGSMGATKLNKSVMSMAGDPDGDGYWLVASDGGIFAFHADFHGSMGNTKLNKPVSGIVPGPAGYLMVAEDGGIFAFGDVAFHGSLGAKPSPSPVISVTLLPARTA
ncbi:MAG: FG-GAP-like repeat-containing protein [Actinobacteria bacterium]|nr:FG-GAP-like repeat-containing protein [Actinomycetota bacterium]